MSVDLRQLNEKKKKKKVLSLCVCTVIQREETGGGKADMRAGKLERCRSGGVREGFEMEE